MSKKSLCYSRKYSKQQLDHRGVCSLERDPTSLSRQGESLRAVPAHMKKQVLLNCMRRTKEEKLTVLPSTVKTPLLEMTKSS